MNRRKFLKWLGVGSAAVVAAPSVLASLGTDCVAVDPLLGAVVPAGAFISEYASYTNFSSFALSAPIDSVVANAAKELGEAAGRDIASLYAQVFA